MNPWVWLILLLALGMIVAGFKGSQDNIIAAILGRGYGNSHLQ